MTEYKKYIILSLVLTFCSTTNHQDLFDLRENARYDSISLNESCLHIQDDPEGDLNYVKALLYTWKTVKTSKDSIASDNLLQALSFIGDVQNINSLSQKTLVPYPQLNDTSYLNEFKRKKIKYFEAKEFILDAFKGKDIIMLNEGHDRPQTRAFVTSLLKDLKKLGVKYLAMETLAEDGNLTELDGTTGYYTPEPSSGEIVREALSLGYKLIPYEDHNYFNHSPNQRDSVQAKNLYDRIKSNNGIEKTLVLAGYAHIAESFDFNTMAMNFKKISGLDPLTIDQIQLIENNNSFPYAHRLLDCTINNGSVLAFKTKDIGFDTTVYDICLFHPKTTYSHNRPSWLLNLNDKQFINVSLPKSIKPVFVQAYLAIEIKNENDYRRKIPCDQTFYSENNEVWLALRKGKEYKIVFRDEHNKIVKMESLTL